jgi:hypothetical protein
VIAVGDAVEVLAVACLRNCTPEDPPWQLRRVQVVDGDRFWVENEFYYREDGSCGPAISLRQESTSPDDDGIWRRWRP